MTAALAPLRRDRGLLALLVVMLFGIPFVTARIYASDEVKYFAYLHSLSFDHDLDFTNDYHYWLDVKKYADIASLLKPNPTTGLPIIGADARVLDANDDEVPWDGVTSGEICVRSNHVMAGYWRAPEATAEVIRDGWLRTGDIATVSPDGYLTLVERPFAPADWISCQMRSTSSQFRWRRVSESTLRSSRSRKS